MKPVIVQVVQHLRPGGIETMALDLLQQLQKKAEVYIFSLEGELQTTLADWPRLNIAGQQLRFFNKQPGVELSLITKLKKALIEVNASAVHTHHIGPLLYGGGAAKLLGLTHVHTEHDAWHLNAKANLRLQNLLIRMIKPNLIADCDEVAAKLVYHFPFSNPKVVLNGIDTKRFKPASPGEKFKSRKALKLPGERCLIGCAARLEAVKGHEFLLKALSQSFTDISLVLAGSGSLRNHLEEEAKRLGISDRVFFLGHLDDTLPFYHAIDMFCLPSLNEGLPLSPLEAQACGIPVIVTDVGGCRSIVCPKTCELIKPGNTTALVNAILRLHYSPYRNNPREFVLSTGNLEKTAEAYFNLLTGPQEV